jgi:hypothetical protein
LFLSGCVVSTFLYVVRMKRWTAYVWSGWLWAVFLKWQLIIERPPYLPSQKLVISPCTL